MADDAIPGIDNEAHVAAVLRARPAGFPVGDEASAVVAVPPPAASMPARPGLRRIAAIPTPQLTAGAPAGARPKFSEIDPALLLVDESYQRGLSKRGVKQVRRIVETWDWRKFKPPVVAITPSGLEILDGQHTAIAAACHPDVHKIPVMVIEATTVQDRAAAFVGHNRERLNLTPMQVHAAAAIGGDAEAQAIDRICAVAGVTILKLPPSTGFQPRQTVAIAAIKALLRRRGEEQAATVLKILADAAMAPVSADWIKAADALLHDNEYAGVLTAEALSLMVFDRRLEMEREAALFVGAHGVRTWKALAVVTFRSAPKRRRKGGDA